jgi:hypothetical protein
MYGKNHGNEDYTQGKQSRFNNQNIINNFTDNFLPLKKKAEKHVTKFNSNFKIKNIETQNFLNLIKDICKFL